MKKLGLFLVFVLSTVMAFASGQQAGSSTGASGPVAITVEVFDRGTDGGKSDPTNNGWTEWIKKKVLADENRPRCPCTRTRQSQSA